MTENENDGLDELLDNVLNDEGSEFGAGVVVCLVKFSEHLWNYWEEQVHHAVRWTHMTDAQKLKERNEAAMFPRGDAAERMRHVDMILGGFPEWSDEKRISHWIEMWMNGASDHFYDLDREKAPPALIELADLCLEMGHGFTEKIWTEKHLTQIRDLWKKACLELDGLLGVKPDWGHW